MAENYFRPLKRGLFIPITGKDDLSKPKYIRGTEGDPGGWLPAESFMNSEQARNTHLDINLFPNGKIPVVFQDAVRELANGQQLTLSWLKDMNAKHRERFYSGDNSEMTCGFEGVTIEKLVNWMNVFHPGWQKQQKPKTLQDIHQTKYKLTSTQTRNNKRTFQTANGVKPWSEMVERYKRPSFVDQKNAVLEKINWATGPQLETTYNVLPTIFTQKKFVRRPPGPPPLPPRPPSSSSLPPTKRRKYTDPLTRHELQVLEEEEENEFDYPKPAIDNLSEKLDRLRTQSPPRIAPLPQRKKLAAEELEENAFSEDDLGFLDLPNVPSNDDLSTRLGRLNTPSARKELTDEEFDDLLIAPNLTRGNLVGLDKNDPLVQELGRLSKYIDERTVRSRANGFVPNLPPPDLPSSLPSLPPLPPTPPTLIVAQASNENALDIITDSLNEQLTQALLEKEEGRLQLSNSNLEITRLQADLAMTKQTIEEEREMYVTARQGETNLVVARQDAKIAEVQQLGSIALLSRNQIDPIEEERIRNSAKEHAKIEFDEQLKKHQDNQTESERKNQELLVGLNNQIEQLQTRLNNPSQYSDTEKEDFVKRINTLETNIADVNGIHAKAIRLKDENFETYKKTVDDQLKAVDMTGMVKGIEENLKKIHQEELKVIKVQTDQERTRIIDEGNALLKSQQEAINQAKKTNENLVQTNQKLKDNFINLEIKVEAQQKKVIEDFATQSANIRNEYTDVMREGEKKVNNFFHIFPKIPTFIENIVTTKYLAPIIKDFRIQLSADPMAFLEVGKKDEFVVKFNQSMKFAFQSIYDEMLSNFESLQGAEPEGLKKIFKENFEQVALKSINDFKFAYSIDIQNITIQDQQIKNQLLQQESGDALQVASLKTQQLTTQLAKNQEESEKKITTLEKEQEYEKILMANITNPSTFELIFSEDFQEIVRQIQPNILDTLDITDLYRNWGKIRAINDPISFPISARTPSKLLHWSNLRDQTIKHLTRYNPMLTDTTLIDKFVARNSNIILAGAVTELNDYLTIKLDSHQKKRNAEQQSFLQREAEVKIKANKIEAEKQIRALQEDLDASNTYIEVGRGVIQDLSERMAGNFEAQSSLPPLTTSIPIEQYNLPTNLGKKEPYNLPTNLGKKEEYISPTSLGKKERQQKFIEEAAKRGREIVRRPHDTEIIRSKSLTRSRNEAFKYDPFAKEESERKDKRRGRSTSATRFEGTGKINLEDYLISINKKGELTTSAQSLGKSTVEELKNMLVTLQNNLGFLRQKRIPIKPIDSARIGSSKKAIESRIHDLEQDNYSEDIELQEDERGRSGRAEKMGIPSRDVEFEQEA